MTSDMTSRKWVEMPAVFDAPTATAVRPKYPIDSSALIVYRGSKVYVVFEDERVRDEVIKYADVHLLTPTDGQQFEDSLPFPLPQEGQDYARGGAIRLGDVVHRVTKRLGLAECSGCRRRRRLLNRVVLRWKKV